MDITVKIPFDEAPRYLSGLRFEAHGESGHLLISVEKEDGTDTASAVVTRADFARILELV